MKVGLISLGCPKNLVDSEVMLGLAREAGHELTADPSEAEVLVVNTCAFIDSAKRESIDAILEMVELKKSGSCQRLVVTGCLAERYRDELRAEIPDIDAVLGTGEVPSIVDAIGAGGQTTKGPASTSAAPLTFFRQSPASPPSLQRSNVLLPSLQRSSELPPSLQRSSELPPSLQRSSELRRDKTEEPRAPVQPRPTYLYDAETPRWLATPRHYAYLKVAEGCDYKCAFCIIPTLRGSYRSRPADSIVREAHALADRGVKELLLISQDTTFYGVDRHERGALARLLRELNQVDGLEWIRLLYLYPTTIDDETLGAMAESDKVCKYIDLPLQHASDQVLRRMRRPGTRRTYDRLLDNIRRRVPGVAIRTTFIVGFPGETDADLAELSSFVADQRFDHLGVFTYSHEEGTSAFDLEDDVPAPTKRTRRARLMSQQKKIVTARHRTRLGERTRVLVDGPASEHELVLRARLASQAPDIDPVVYLSDCDPSTLRPGEFVEVEIAAARGYDLVARVL